MLRHQNVADLRIRMSGNEARALQGALQLCPQKMGETRGDPLPAPDRSRQVRSYHPEP